MSEKIICNARVLILSFIRAFMILMWWQGCQQLIVSGAMLKILDGVWHPACFKCQVAPYALCLMSALCLMLALCFMSPSCRMPSYALCPPDTLCQPWLMQAPSSWLALSRIVGRMRHCALRPGMCAHEIYGPSLNLFACSYI